MYQHWRTCFELLDEDGSKEVSRTEFELLGFLFNFTHKAVGTIYKEFDVTGNAVLFTQYIIIKNRNWIQVNSDCLSLLLWIFNMRWSKKREEKRMLDQGILEN